MEQDRSAEARNVLTKINGRSIAEQELKEIETTVAEESGKLSELLQPGLRKPFWIAISLAILQQITGINTVLFYGAVIFKQQVHS